MSDMRECCDGMDGRDVSLNRWRNRIIVSLIEGSCCSNVAVFIEMRVKELNYKRLSNRLV